MVLFNINIAVYKKSVQKLTKEGEIKKGGKQGTKGDLFWHCDRRETQRNVK